MRSPSPSDSGGGPADLHTPSDFVSSATAPRGYSHYRPPAAPTPPNEPASERERLIRETNTFIATNPTSNGGRQILLQITENEPKKQKEIKATIGTTPQQQSRMLEGPLPDSLRYRDYSDRGYHNDDDSHYRSGRYDRGGYRSHRYYRRPDGRGRESTEKRERERRANTSVTSPGILGYFLMTFLSPSDRMLSGIFKCGPVMSALLMHQGRREAAAPTSTLFVVCHRPIPFESEMRPMS